MLTITTTDGVAEAIVASPPDGRGPGVLFFMDAFGLRPRIQEMAEEIAGWGYVVLAPNVFYRDGTVAELASQVDLSTPSGRDSHRRAVGALPTAKLSVPWMDILSKCRTSSNSPGPRSNEPRERDIV